MDKWIRALKKANKALYKQAKGIRNERARIKRKGLLANQSPILMAELKRRVSAIHAQHLKVSRETIKPC